jgi:hypothetical protein
MSEGEISVQLDEELRNRLKARVRHWEGKTCESCGRVGKLRFATVQIGAIGLQGLDAVVSLEDVPVVECGCKLHGQSVHLFQPSIPADETDEKILRDWLVKTSIGQGNIIIPLGDPKFSTIREHGRDEIRERTRRAADVAFSNQELIIKARDARLKWETERHSRLSS